MKKIYNFDNAVVEVISWDTYDRESFKNATERFIKKIFLGGNDNGYFNTSGNFSKK